MAALSGAMEPLLVKPRAWPGVSSFREPSLLWSVSILIWPLQDSALPLQRYEEIPIHRHPWLRSGYYRLSLPLARARSAVFLTYQTARRGWTLRNDGN